MSLTDRDKKVALILVPVIVLAAFWFLVLAPKRHEAAAASEQAEKQGQKLDRARAKLAELQASKASFRTDYARMVSLGKAVPTSVDMPSLMVQLESAAKGTGISFTKIEMGKRQEASSSSSPPASASGSSKPTDAGGASTQSAPGGAVESANNAKQTSDQKSAAAEKSGASASDTQTSTASRPGLPVGGGAAAATGGPGASSVPGLDTVPLNLEFQGNYLKLANFFHRLKRFVRVVNERAKVQGRLMTVEGLNFSTDTELFPKVKAEMTATVYLAPESEGSTAGASPQGPSAANPAGGTTPAGSTGSSPTPAATATPAP